MSSSKCMIWNDKSKHYQSYRKCRWLDITISVNEQFFFIILATHDIKVDFFAVAVIFGSHCIPRAVQEQIKKLKLKIKTDDDFVLDAKTDESGSGAKKIAKVKTADEALKNVKQVSKKRKVNEDEMKFLSSAFEKGQKSDESVVRDQKLNAVADADDIDRLLVDYQFNFPEFKKRFCNVEKWFGVFSNSFTFVRLLTLIIESLTFSVWDANFIAQLKSSSERRVFTLELYEQITFYRFRNFETMRTQGSVVIDIYENKH